MQLVTERESERDTRIFRDETQEPQQEDTLSAPDAGTQPLPAAVVHWDSRRRRKNEFCGGMKRQWFGSKISMEREIRNTNAPAF